MTELLADAPAMDHEVALAIGGDYLSEEQAAALAGFLDRLSAERRGRAAKAVLFDAWQGGDRAPVR